MKSYTTKAYQWVDIYRSATDGEIKAVLKAFYKMEYWQGLHVALWAWLSLDGKREKRDWFKTFNVPKVKHDCFACEMAEMAYDCLPKWLGEDKPPICLCCPIIDSEAEECLDGLYGKWLVADSEQKEKLARKIATMKWEEKL